MELFSFIEQWKTKNLIRNTLKSIDLQDRENFDFYLNKKENLIHFKESAFILLLNAGTETEDLYFLNKLLNLGLNPNSLDDKGVSVLHYYVEMGRVEATEILLKRSANPNIQDPRGITPLHVANSYDGLSEISDLLLSHGADPNLRDNIGKRYLM